MQVQALTVHNFRTICDVQIRLTDYTLLVGANNAGKSNVVNAMRWFFGEYDYKRDKDFPRMKGVGLKDNLTWVEVEFGCVARVEVGAKLADVVRNGTIRVRRTLEIVQGSPKSWYCAVDGEGRSLKGTTSFKTLPKGLSLAVSYIPSMSNPSDDLKLTGTSLLKDLIGDSIKAAFEKSDAVAQLQKTVKRLVMGSKSADGVDGGALAQFEKKVKEAVRDWGASFALGTKNIELSDIVKNMLEIHVGDVRTHGETDIERFGSGFQRNLIFSIIRSAAEIKMLGDGGTSRLLIFEEPEAFLHPDQQEELARSLCKLAEHGFQVVCTSHSPCFVGRKMDDVPGIVRVMKNKGVTTARQITDEAWKRIVKSGGDYPKYLLPHVRENTASLDSFRYAFWFAGQRASVCFARQVLLVEGATEAALFARLQDDDKLHLPQGAVIVDCMGKFNFHRFMLVMREWGIPFAVVYDDDSGKTGDGLKKQQAWNKFVEENAKKSKPKANTLAIKEDIEKLLGVEKYVGRPDLKPCHLLNEYKEGRCSRDRLDKLCRDIEGLFKGVKVA